MLLSIIVPVYNTDKYLQRCINSILIQTYANFELLLIDDGSTDSSGTLCDEYAKKDIRVRVFHKENGGVSSARKLGLENARGEWVTFVDSDDWIDESFLHTMYVNVSSEIDLIVTAGSDKCLSHEEYVREILERRIPPQVWGKLYRKSVLKNALSLPRNLYWGEDLISNVLVGLNVQKKVLLKRCFLYNYSINEASVSTQRKSSIEYEEYFLEVLKSKMGDEIIKYKDSINYTALYIVEDLIVCKQKVHYDLMWIKDLIEWGKTQPLSFRQKIVLTIKNNLMCRYILAFERRLKRIYKSNV